jgi:hypothetical protein
MPELSRDAFIPQMRDFCHLGANVHKARREIYGEEDQVGKGWAGEQSDRTRFVISGRRCAARQTMRGRRRL